MRRSSFTSLKNSSAQEPLIVVEETQCTDHNEHNDNEVQRVIIRHDGDGNKGQIETNIKVNANNNNNNNNNNINNNNNNNKSNNNNNNNNNNDDGVGDVDSPKNPYLLCPFPDMQQRRKHSLPSLQISDGMMASQVRRLSDAGGETGSLSPHDVEFLTTLTQKSNSTVSGRRHSVITISAIQSTPLFGRNRRESIAGVSCSRRGSGFHGPPLTDHRGSIHNLQLDIMDGIVQTRKGRTGIWAAPILKETESNVPLQA